MDKIAFTKMEGCGNDYVYVDGINTAFPIARAPDLARRWSDRHFGIGADGLIVLARDPDGALRMLMWNADGSRGAMCGNGLRCLARFAEVSGHTTGQAFVVMTDSGRRQVELLGAGNGSGDVRTHMGMVTCQLARPIEVAGGSYDFICGDAGNPHAVTFVADVELAAADKIGAALQAHPGTVVASCSALRQHYRDLLRQSTPALKFVFLRITQAQALERVRERSGHYMPPELVRSQFNALEPPTDEDGVIAIEAEWPTPLQVRTVLAWLAAPDAIPPPRAHR